MTPEELRALYLEALQAGQLDAAELYLQRLEQPPAQPMLQQPVQPVPFQPAFTTRLQQREEAAQIAEAATAQRALSPAARDEERQDEERRALAAIERERARPVQAGRGAVRTALDAVPFTRPSRIQRLPVYRTVPEELRAQLSAADIADIETRQPAAGSTAQPLEVRAYYRTSEGTLRAPSRFETFTEGFAQQPVLSERAAREQAAMQTQELQRALAGERLPPFAATLPGLALSALTQQRQDGAGIVETGLQALLRGSASAGSALGAEVIGSSIPAAQTQRAVFEPTPLDPELRRRASSDPDFVDRVLENISTGRGIGDEYYDINVFRETAGDIGAALSGEDSRAAAELVPFYVGTVVDMAAPSYIGLTKAAGKAALQVAPGSLTGAVQQPLRRTVARRLINESTLSEEVKQPLLQAIRASDGTEEGITAAVRRPLEDALGADAPAAFRTELQRRTPADYEFVTDSVAVPRGTAAEVRAAVQTEVQRTVQRAPAEQAQYLRTLAALASDTGQTGAQRTASFADTHFPGAAGQQVRQARLTSAEASTVQELVRAADALQDSGSAVAQRSALAALGRLEQQAGLPAGTLRTRLVQRAPAEATATLPAPLRAAVRDADNWGALPIAVRDEAFEALRAQAAIDAARSAGVQPRRAADLSALQVALRSEDPVISGIQRLSDSQIARWVRAAYGKPVPPASVARAVDIVRTSAEGALRAAERRIVALAQQTRSTDKAYERFLVESTADSTGSDRWQKALNVLYGEEGVKRLLPRLQASVDDLDDVPLTVAALRAFNADAARAGLVPRLPLWSRPARRTLLQVALDEGVRKRLISEGIALEARLSSAVELPGAAPGLPKWATLAGGAQPVQRPVQGGLRTYNAAASRAEQKLAEGSEELVRFIERVAPAQRSSVAAMAIDAGSYLLGAGKTALVNARYGFAGLPNLPYLLYRLTEAPILSIATIGTQRTLAGVQQLTRRAVDAAMRQLGARRIGAGLTAPDGRHYSPAQLQALAEQQGLGILRTETQRIGQLADDIERAARAAAAGPAGKALDMTRSVFDPTVKSFYLRVAESVEQSFRRSVFEGGIAAGLPVSDAAELARRSLLDFGAQPAQVRAIGRLFASAQGQYGLLTELTFKTLQNPEAIGALSRGMLARQRAADPYGLDGDAALTRLGIVRGGTGQDALRFYGPQNPLFMPLESALSVVRHAGLLINDVQRTLEEQPADLPVLFAEEGVRLTAAALPMVQTYLELQGAEDGAPIPAGAAVGEQQFFWQSAIAARAADPDGSAGIWQLWSDIAMPDEVQPPAGLQHAQLPQYWTQQPPAGTPHLLYAYDEAGLPLYKVYKPSARGLQNLALIRALTPDALERAIGATAALIDAPAGLRAPGAVTDASQPPVQIFGGTQAPAGAGAAAGILLGSPAGPADPAAARRAQIELLRQTREGQ